MNLSDAELLAVLRQFNPWWTGATSPDLPTFKRVAFVQVREWAEAPPAGRALLLTGARQVGKTTIFLQAVEALRADGVPSANILYATFDHPLLKLAGPDRLLKIWRDHEPREAGPEYLFLDEIQSIPEWQVWVKHQVDFTKERRIALTGSAMPLTRQGQESGVGRWMTIQLPTLTFFEYLQLRLQNDPELQKRLDLRPVVPPARWLGDPFSWREAQFARAAEMARGLVPHFNEYLLRGGFPQCALVPGLPLAQKLLREDIVDKVLKRDMTALFGVRRVVELEQLFLYLCLHGGGILSIPDVCKNLQIKRPTVENFLDLLEASHLIYRLRPHGYGKEVLRGRSKIYLADPAISPAVLLKGKELLEQDELAGLAVETAFFKHLYARYYAQKIGFTYWRGGGKDEEVDVIADLPEGLVPFEVKYRGRDGKRAPGGLLEFCREKKVRRAYLVTREIDDFGRQSLTAEGGKVELLRLPAALACYWLGSTEHRM